MRRHGKSMLPVKGNRTLKHLNPFFNVLGSKSAFHLLASGSIVLDDKKNLAIDPFQSDPDLFRLPVPDRICNTFLYHAIDGIFFIFIKLQMLLIRLKIDRHIRNLTHIRHHLADCHFQAQTIQRIRP